MHTECQSTSTSVPSTMCTRYWHLNIATVGVEVETGLGCPWYIYLLAVVVLSTRYMFSCTALQPIPGDIGE